MIKYNISVNNGVEAFAQEGKTVTANEVVETVDSRFMAHHMHLHNALIPEQVIQNVLDMFCECAAELMAQGKAVVLPAKGRDALRLYPDVHVQGGNINLNRAQSLIEGTTDITTANAGELVQKAGLTVRAKAECEVLMTELLKAEKPSMQRNEIIERAKVERKDNAEQPGNEDNGGDNGGEDNGNE